MNRTFIKPPTLGVIFGNRDFFPDLLVTEVRADVQKDFAERVNWCVTSISQ